MRGDRKSYDGLSALVDSELGMRPTSGDLFIFLNRRATQMRILFWDRDGYCVVMKRLERGTFRRVTSADGESYVEVDGAELAMLLEGIDATPVRRRKRYRLAEDATRCAAPWSAADTGPSLRGVNRVDVSVSAVSIRTRRRGTRPSPRRAAAPQTQGRTRWRGHCEHSAVLGSTVLAGGVPALR